jgi:hypothetical protein
MVEATILLNPAKAIFCNSNVKGGVISPFRGTPAAGFPVDTPDIDGAITTTTVRAGGGDHSRELESISRNLSETVTSGAASIE